MMHEIASPPMVFVHKFFYLTKNHLSFRVSHDDNLCKNAAK